MLGYNSLLSASQSGPATEFFRVSAAAQAVIQVCIGSPIAYGIDPLILSLRGEFVERDLRTLRAEVFPCNICIATRCALLSTLCFLLRPLDLGCFKLRFTLRTLLGLALLIGTVNIHATTNRSQLLSNLRGGRRRRWCERYSQRQAFLARSFQFGLGGRSHLGSRRWCAKWDRLST